MDLNDLSLFVAVAERGGFSAAARDLGISKSNASQRVKNLEAQLGVQLLARTTRQVSLTEAGLTLLERGRDIVSAANDAEQLVSVLRTSPIGSLRISTPVSFGRRFWGQILAKLLSVHPGLSMTLDLEDRDVDLVAERYDLAVRLGDLPPSGLMARSIGSARRIVVGAPSYLELRGRPQQPDDLRDHECLRFSHRRTPGVWTFNGSGGRLDVRVSGRLVCNNGDVLADAAAEGLGLAWLPDFIVADHLSQGRLEQVLATHCESPLPVHLVFPARRHRLMKVQVFADALEAALRHTESGGATSA